MGPETPALKQTEDARVSGSHLPRIAPADHSTSMDMKTIPVANSSNMVFHLRSINANATLTKIANMAAIWSPPNIQRMASSQKNQEQYNQRQKRRRSLGPFQPGHHAMHFNRVLNGHVAALQV